MTSISDRLKEAGAGKPPGWKAELARKCGVKPPSVSGWLSGDSKNIDAENLFKAADFLEVNPRWLCFGIGPKDAKSSGGTIVPFEQPGSISASLEILVMALNAANKSTREAASGMLATLAKDPHTSANIAQAIEVLLTKPPEALKAKSKTA